MIKKMKLYSKQTKPISCKTRSHCESKHPRAIQMTSKASHDMLVSWKASLVHIMHKGGHVTSVPATGLSHIPGSWAYQCRLQGNPAGEAKHMQRWASRSEALLPAVKLCPHSFLRSPMQRGSLWFWVLLTAHTPARWKTPALYTCSKAFHETPRLLKPVRYCKLRLCCQRTRWNCVQ